MSLSQKHAGLILVPWFNSAEWRYVYHSVYSNNPNKQVKALEMLKIWKLRTPILSTGVEGTLILLDALLLDTDSLSNEQVSNLYAIALMRFLNLSAANSEKQGSFTKMSTQNVLPKWLINLRHDIAHGHQIPSLYNLKMGLDFGFNWLKERYWEPQSKIIKDYYIREDSISDSLLSNSVNAYVEINMGLFENQELDNEYIQTIKDTIYKKIKRNVPHPSLMLSILLEMVTQCLEKNHHKDQLCLNALVSTRALLKPNFEMVQEEEGNKRLDKNFRNIWQNLLNIFHQYGLLFVLIEKLFDIVGDLSHSDNSKKMAAMWINELFVSLTCLKDSQKTAGDDGLHLNSSQYNYSKEALDLETRALHCSNAYSVYFLESLLKYNLKNDLFYQEVLTLNKASSENVHQAVGKIYTLEDLKVENLSVEDFLMEDRLESDIFSSQIVAGRRWKKIEDTSIFKNCPLGVLPHQVGDKHLFLGLA